MTAVALPVAQASDPIPNQAAAANIDAVFKKARAKRKAGDLTAALGLLKLILSTDANHPATLAEAFSISLKLDLVRDSYLLGKRACDHNPTNACIQNNYACFLLSQKKYNKALHYFDASLEHDPHSVVTLYNVGLCCAKMKDADGALKYFGRVLEFEPGHDRACEHCAYLYAKNGMWSEASDIIRRTLLLRPGNDVTNSRFLYWINCLGEYSDEEKALESRLWSTRFAEPLIEKDNFQSLIDTSASEAKRPLRIGFVSADLRTHSVAFFLLPFLRHYDRSQLHVSCYSNVARPDAMSETLKHLCDNWCDISSLDDTDAKRAIKDDGIQVLIDLSGHTSNHRLLLFARQPAPMLVTWLGFPATTGLKNMDYRIVDHITDPASVSDSTATETLSRLDRCFVCYEPPEASLDISPTANASNDTIVFGSFNTLSKLNPELIRVWAQILETVPKSQLLLKRGELRNKNTVRYIESRFSEQGIDPSRLRLEFDTPKLADHLKTYHDVDIALDPFPYNGTTTTCEALWMGVPVVTLTGSTHAARVGASLLKTIQLNELITSDESGYVALATRLATDHEYRRQLKTDLRDRMQNSPLCDGADFAQSLTSKLNQLWQEKLQS